MNNQSLAKKLDEIDNLSEEFVDSCATKFLEDVKAGRREEEEWCSASPNYNESKMFMHAYTRALAKTLESTNSKVHVNVVHPGYIDTPGTSPLPNEGKQPIEVGSDTAVWLALLPPGEEYPNGKIYFKRKPHNFVTSFY
jgi:NAD(P)-dependent dehydrogenase (short-subunit alcohol dehydrogenase family)